jgi:caffeoyl-CoA O-methyltransferase
MSSRNNNISDELNDYIQANSLRDRPELKALRDVTADMPNAGMQISPDQGQLMALLVKATGARKAIEVGTFTGYSALVVASALPEDGTLVACDVSEEFTSVGRSHWERAGVASKIDLRLGPAVKTLDAMIAAGEAGQYDMAFIDADKENYLNYYERCLTLLRPGGLILFDNMLWGGRAANPKENDVATKAIRALTRTLHADERIDVSLLPVGDGLSLAVKR